MTQKTQVTTPVLNITPLPTPISPYYFGYRYLAAGGQADTMTAEGAAALKERQTYLLWLSKKLPKTESHEPILLLALTRAALDVRARNFLLDALDELDQLVRATAIPVTTPPPAPRPTPTRVAEVVVPTPTPAKEETPIVVETTATSTSVPPIPQGVKLGKQKPSRKRA